MSKLSIIPTLNYQVLNDSGNPVMSHEQIALHTGNTEDGVYRLVTKYKSQLEEFGVLGFQIRKPLAGSKGGAPKTIYYLNEQQTTLLVMFMRNNEIVVKFKVAVIKDYYEAKSWLRDRESCKLEFKNMNSELKMLRDLQGKETKFYHYSVEADLINRTVLGLTAKKYCEVNYLERESLRSSLNRNQLSLIDKLEAYNTSLIISGLQYDERKELLAVYYSKLVQRYLTVDDL